MLEARTLEQLALAVKDGDVPVGFDVLPRSLRVDVPQLDVEFLPERDIQANPLHAKGIGELGICGAAGAVGNAIYNATGVRVRDFPVTLDKLLEGLPAV